MPDFKSPCREQKQQGQSAQTSSGVAQHHAPTSVPAVYQHARHG